MHQSSAAYTDSDADADADALHADDDASSIAKRRWRASASARVDLMASTRIPATSVKKTGSVATNASG